MRAIHAVTAAVILSILSAGASAKEQTKPRGKAGVIGAKQPCFTPDGKKILFSLHGDIWTLATEGGAARRVTLHEANDIKPRISPDGSKVAFSANREGNYDVWITPVEGGAPKQLTFHSSYDIISDWSPDGKTVLFYSSRNGRYDLWTIPAAGGTPRQITFDGAIHGAYSPDGKQIAFVRGFTDISRRYYQGSSNYDLYVIPARGGVPKRLTRTPWNERNPVWSKDGKAIFCLAEKDGSYNVFKVPLEGGAAEQLSRMKGSDARDLQFSRGTGDFVFVKDFTLWRIAVGTGKLIRVPVQIRSDTKGWTREKRTLTDGAENPSWSADGTKIAFSLNGDIWIMPSSGGKARRITSGPGIDQWPKWSPDGSQIAFYSDRSGNQDIWIVPARGGTPRQLTTHKADDFFHNWSPDGKRLVFCSERSGNRDLWLIPADGGDPFRLTKHKAADDDPCYSPDGKWIAFDSGRSGNQDIWVMPSTGGEARRITTNSGEDQVPTWSPDGRFLAFDSYRQGSRSIWVISSRGGPDMQISNLGSTPQWSPNGETIIFEVERNGSKMIWQVAAPKSIVTGKPVNFIAEIEVDRKKEFVRVFDQAWLAIKNGFYDKKMHGVDWKSVRKKYRPVAERAEIREELYGLIDRMLGELRASHMGIWGMSRKRTEAMTGYLGLTLAWPEGKSPSAMKVMSVLAGGPADKAWIRKGDYIFSIDRVTLKPGVNFYRLLNGKIGKSVRVEVGPTPDRKKGRILTIEPVSRRTIAARRYALWIRGRREMAKSLSKGRVGYIHLSAMNNTNLNRFRTALSGRLKRKQALILDVRNNGGGYIHQQLLDILNRKPYAYYQSRGRKRRPQQNPVWAKPVVVLINERSFSDAEIFPYGFKKMGLGKVIGVSTSGGVIGTGKQALADGSTLRMPRTGWYGNDGTNLEGHGVKPDIVVEETPEDRREKRDPQLAKGVEILMEEIKERAKEKKEKKKPEKKPPPKRKKMPI
jgi:tricorn protease